MIHEADKAEELYQRGLQAFQEQNIQQGFECLRQAAKLNHADALYELGRRYAHTTGFNNVNEEVQCYQKAADLGHPGAMNQLGYFLVFRGDSPLPKDPERAKILFEKSYELSKDPEALINLAKLYIYGRKEPEFPRDIPKAMSFFAQANKELLHTNTPRFGNNATMAFKEAVHYRYAHIFPFIMNMMEDNQKFQQQIADHQKEIKHLQAQVKYQPEGPGYLEAKEEFETLQSR